MKRTYKRILLVVIAAILIFVSFKLVEVYRVSKGIGKVITVIENISISKGIQNGDIIFQTSKSNQSKAIQLATHSKYSHMGIIYENNGKLFVYEAIQPVKLTPLVDWIERGENKHYVVKRLKHADKLLTPEKLLEIKTIGEKYNGKDYDIYFEWSNDRIYCSELVWKIFKEALDIEIGKLEKLSDFNLENSTVKKIMKQRYGENIPLDEIVISPASMFDSDKIELVKEN
ncbi:MAG: YiiX family permuted papain-like enzyme [Alphaproteobacteria bacterium]